MVDVIAILIHAIAAALRKLWQKITGRVPVPVRVPVRRMAPLDRADLFSRSPVMGPLSLLPGAYRRH